MTVRQTSRDTTLTESECAAPEGELSSLALLRIAPQPATEAVTLRHGLIIGRDAACDVQTHTGSTSRRHAVLAFEGHLWRLADRGSRNGTFVNGLRIRRAPVGPGDVVRCGGWVAIVIRRTCESYGLGFRALASGLYGGASLQLALKPLRKIAPSALGVLLEGETGTGKECVTRAIHEWSGRTGPYLALNCAALPETLAEAELFGYERGAFTGATQGRIGHLRAASGGTLLLDEICDLSSAVQSKLLRALDQREVIPLGASAPIPIDVRVVAAAQRPLEPLVQDGRFREDLLARLGVTVRLPPLRERREDIPFLLELFAQEAFGRLPELDARLIEALTLYSYPRNVRELRQVVEQLAWLHEDAPALRVTHLPEQLRAEQLRVEAPSPSSVSGRRVTPEWERLRAALEATDGNVRRAAQDVGISRYQAYRLLRAHPEFDVACCRQRRDSSMLPEPGSAP